MGRIGRAIARRLEPCACRSSITRESGRAACPISIIPTFRDGAGCRYAAADRARRCLRPSTWSMPKCSRRSGRTASDQHRARLGRRRGGADRGAAGEADPGRRPRRVREEPKVPPELIEMDNVVLLPHVGSASQHTRRRWNNWSSTIFWHGARASRRSRRCLKRLGRQRRRDLK